MSKTLTDIIALVRKLRLMSVFKYAMKSCLLMLLIGGTWVATQPMKMDESFDVSDKLVHIIVFFGFALVTDLVTSRKPFWFWKGVPLLSYGLFIEVLQYFSPDRSFSLLDWVADFIGIVIYYSLKYFFRRLAEYEAVNEQRGINR